LNCAEFWGQDDNLDWDKWFGEKGYLVASTTVVGQFPTGSTPEGLCELSGNVWEWTDSWYEKGHINRALRGGSWFNYRWNARCALRFRFDPVGFNNDIGFRVVSHDNIQMTGKS